MIKLTADLIDRNGPYVRCASCKMPYQLHTLALPPGGLGVVAVECLDRQAIENLLSRDSIRDALRELDAGNDAPFRELMGGSTAPPMQQSMKQEEGSWWSPSDAPRQKQEEGPFGRAVRLYQIEQRRQQQERQQKQQKKQQQVVTVPGATARGMFTHDE